jgi:hypothetical protein
MRPPSTWLSAIALALLATFVLQFDPASFGPVVEIGRVFAQVTVVGVVALVSWQVVTVGYDWTRRSDRRHVLGVVVALVSAAVAAVLLGFLGFGDALGAVLTTLVGITGVLSVVSAWES